MLVAIIDYGLGNVQSVIGAVEKLGSEAILTNSYEELSKADALILPGVGAFGDGMKHLKKRNLIDVLNKLVIQEKKPILGICLGMQLFASKGYEFGEYNGLNWIEGEVRKFDIDPQFKLPHIGWNDINNVKDSLLLDDINDKLFYFVHSYYFSPKNDSDIIATCDYGKEFSVIVNRENIFGVQFHPEKSQKEGLVLIENFLKKCCNA